MQAKACSHFKWVDVSGYGKCAEFTPNEPTTTTGSGLRVWVNAPAKDDIGSIRGIEGFRVGCFISSLSERIH